MGNAETQKKRILFQKKRFYLKRKGLNLKEKDFYVRRKGFLYLKEKDLSEKKSNQKKRKENYFYQPLYWDSQMRYYASLQIKKKLLCQLHTLRAIIEHT